MLICRGDVLGMHGLCEILGTMAQEFERRMLLGRWGDGGSSSYLITTEDAPVVHSPAFEPIILALPDGAIVPMHDPAQARWTQDQAQG
jgi:hypothetical protein